MEKKKMKLLFAVLSLVLIESWFLCVLRFHWEPASALYSILNIPLGLPNIFIEDFLWKSYGHSHWVNDEIVGGLRWLLFVIGQGIFYYYVIQKLIPIKKTKKHCDV